MNGTPVTVNGVTVAVGQAVLASVSGGTSATRYSCEARCDTTASPAQRLVVEFVLVVQDQIP